MPADVNELLDRVCDRIGDHLDTDRIETARARTADVMADETPDYLPIIFRRPLELDENEWPNFDWSQQFNDPAKSLYSQLKDVLAQVESGSDAIPSVRPDTGVINCMTVFGAGYTVPEHTKPVINEFVDKDRLQAFEVPEDISECGVIPIMVEHMTHHIETLEERGLAPWVNVRHCDQQGPFDIAAQTRGHEMFIDLHRDEDFVHELMGKTTAVYIAVSKLCKELNGEPLDGGNVYGVWMHNGGVRMCGDSDILMNPAKHQEFVKPYQEKAFEPFGGGWFHYCGGWEGTSRSEGLHLHPTFGQVRGLRGLNWTTAGNWIEEMTKLRKLGVVHIGGVPREEGESLEGYFHRVLRPYEEKGGLIFLGPELKDGEYDRAVATWHRVQDEHFETA